MDIYLVIFITLVAALIASFSQLMYKRSMSRRLDSVRDIVLMVRKRGVLIGLGGYTLSLAIYLFALSKAQLSVVYPTFASTFIFITILSAVMLRERMNAKRVIGVALVFLGILVVAATL